MARSGRVAAALAVVVLGGCGGRDSDPVSRWMRLTSDAGGAASLDYARPADEPTDAYHNRLIAQSLEKCDDYRRSVSVTQRSTSSGLAWGSASAGALGLAFTPAGAATLAGFTAAGAILASGSATLASTGYAGLTPQTIEQRLRRDYSLPMHAMAQDISSASLARIASLHSRCSVAYLLGEPTD